MIGPLRRAPDPFWDDGKGARRRRRRLRLEGVVALGLAIIACGLTVAVWLLVLAPLWDRIALI